MFAVWYFCLSNNQYLKDRFLQQNKSHFKGETKTHSGYSQDIFVRRKCIAELQMKLRSSFPCLFSWLVIYCSPLGPTFTSQELKAKAVAKVIAPHIVFFQEGGVVDKIHSAKIIFF